MTVTFSGRKKTVSDTDAMPLKRIARVEKRDEPTLSKCIEVDSPTRLFRAGNRWDSDSAEGGESPRSNSANTHDRNSVVDYVGKEEAREALSFSPRKKIAHLFGAGRRKNTAKNAAQGAHIGRNEISVDSVGSVRRVRTGGFVSHNSVLQRAIIFACILRPEKWYFAGIDLKKVELSPYMIYKNVVLGVATTLENALEVLRFAQQTMMKRYESLEQLGLKNFLEMPGQNRALMVMIDEYGEAASPTGSKTDEGKEQDAMKGEIQMIVGSIARLGRAAGVHLVVATQRPDAKMLPGEVKSLDKNTPVLTSNGYKKMEDISIGDTVFDKNGEPSKVVNMTEIMHDRECYELTFSNGEKIVCDATHRWPVVTEYQRKEGKKSFSREENLFPRRNILDKLLGVEHDNDTEMSIPEIEYAVNDGRCLHLVRSLARDGKLAPSSTGKYKVSQVIAAVGKEGERLLSKKNDKYNCSGETMTAEAIYSYYEAGKGDKKAHKLSVKKPPSISSFGRTDVLEVEPYAVGCWFGGDLDGSKCYTRADEHVQENTSSRGHKGLERRMGDGVSADVLRSYLFSIEGFDGKKIPERYLFADEKARRELLAGLLDSNEAGGRGKNGEVVFCTANETIADNVLFISRSLGYTAAKIDAQVSDLSLYDGGERGEKQDTGKKCKPVWGVTFTADDDVFNCESIEVSFSGEKEREENPQERHDYIDICSIKKVNSVPQKCIEVDNDSHTYLCGESLIPTHNSNLGVRINCGYTNSMASSMILDGPEGTKVKPNPKGRFYIKIYSSGNHGQAFWAKEDWMDKYLDSQGLNADGTPKDGGFNAYGGKPEDVAIPMTEKDPDEVGQWDRPEDDWDDEMDDLIAGQEE